MQFFKNIFSSFSLVSKKVTTEIQKASWVS